MFEIKDKKIIENTIKVRDKKTGMTYDCFPQMVDINFNGRYSLRYNIGIMGFTEWTFIHAIYDNDTFNEKYEVIGGFTI